MGKKNIKTRGTPGTPGFEYYSEDENVGDAKPGIGGRALGGLLSLLTGIPVVGSAIGSAIDKYKPKSMYDDMSEFNNLQLVDGELVDIRNIESKNIPVGSNVGMDSLALQNFYDKQNPIKTNQSTITLPQTFSPSLDFDIGRNDVLNNALISDDGLSIYDGS